MVIISIWNLFWTLSSLQPDDEMLLCAPAPGRVPILREYGHWAPWRGLGPKNGGALFRFLRMGGGSLPTFDGYHQPHLLPTLLHLR